MVMKPLLNRVSGKPIKSDVTTFTGGLNTCYDRSMIQDNQLSYVWNMSFKNTMSMTTRSDRISMAWFMNDTTTWGSGKIMKIFATTEQTFFTIETNLRTEVYLHKRVGNFMQRTYIGTVETASKYYMTECRDTTHQYVFISTRNKLYKITITALSTTLAEVTGTPPTGIVRDHKNRLFIANGTSLKFSTLREYTDFMTKMEIGATTGDTDNFTVDKEAFINQLTNLELGNGTYRIRATDNNGTVTLDGSRYDKTGGYWSTSPAIPTSAFTALDIPTNESKQIYVIVSTDSSAGEINITNAKGTIKALIPFDDKLIIFCDRSRHILYGDSPNPEENIFQIVDLDDGIGTISDETVCICDRMLYFVDRDLSVYRFNGASTTKISEPYGNDNYASYGGISGITYSSADIDNFILCGHENRLYFGLRRAITVGTENDTFLVYDTKNRIWSAEDGAFSHLTFLDTNGFYANGTDILIGVRYNNDIVIIDRYQGTDTDKLFNMETREFDDVPIEYGFETKTWNLGEIKRKKTLTNVWFQADADAEVGVCDYWTNHGKEPDFKDNYLVLGRLKPVGVRHNVQHPYYWLHEGNERQRFIIPRMYMQKINAFSIRVEGKGDSKFFLMQKEWREA